MRHIANKALSARSVSQCPGGTYSGKIHQKFEKPLGVLAVESVFPFHGFTSAPHRPSFYPAHQFPRTATPCRTRSARFGSCFQSDRHLTRISVSPPPPTPTRVTSADSQRWFAESVHTHDSSLKAYLRGQFPSVRDVDDVVQESYLRVWRRQLARPIRSAKAFLFQVARHLAIDAIRHQQVAKLDSLEAAEECPVVGASRDAAAQLCYEEKIELLAAAFVSLPPRCREIMTLRKLKGVSVREIARQMDLAEGTVENQITRGIHLCRAYLRERGIDTFSDQ